MGGAIVAVFGGEPIGVGIHIDHSAKQTACRADLPYRPTVVDGRRAVAEQLCAGEGGFPGNVEQIFYRVGNPRQRR